MSQQPASIGSADSSETATAVTPSDNEVFKSDLQTATLIDNILYLKGHQGDNTAIKVEDTKCLTYLPSQAHSSSSVVYELKSGTLIKNTLHLRGRIGGGASIEVNPDDLPCLSDMLRRISPSLLVPENVFTTPAASTSAKPVIRKTSKPRVQVPTHKSKQLFRQYFVEPSNSTIDSGYVKKLTHLLSRKNKISSKGYTISVNDIGHEWDDKWFVLIFKKTRKFVIVATEESANWHRPKSFHLHAHYMAMLSCRGRLSSTQITPQFKAIYSTRKNIEFKFVCPAEQNIFNQELTIHIKLEKSTKDKLNYFLSNVGTVDDILKKNPGLGDATVKGVSLTSKNGKLCYKKPMRFIAIKQCISNKMDKDESQQGQTAETAIAGPSGSKDKIEDPNQSNNLIAKSDNSSNENEALEEWSRTFVLTSQQVNPIGPQKLVHPGLIAKGPQFWGQKETFQGPARTGVWNTSLPAVPSPGLRVPTRELLFNQSRGNSTEDDGDCVMLDQTD